MNLIMNSKEPHPPVEAPWSEGSMELNWRGFQAARQIWVIEKGYDPCADGPPGGVAVPAGGAPTRPGAGKSEVRGPRAEGEVVALVA